MQPRVAPAESLQYAEKNKSPDIKPYSTILHPGEVMLIDLFIFGVPNVPLNIL